MRRVVQIVPSCSCEAAITGDGHGNANIHTQDPRGHTQDPRGHTQDPRGHTQNSHRGAYPSHTPTPHTHLRKEKHAKESPAPSPGLSF
jgi:hypothetical protein